MRLSGPRPRLRARPPAGSAVGWALAALLFSACSADESGGAGAEEAGTPELDRRAAPLIEQTRPDRPALERRRAFLALGRLGGDAARRRLIELLGENTKDPVRDGATHLYAAAGLTLAKDPGAAIDLLLALSQVNPNDNIAALASEERNEEYFTVDAQICDALLSMGLVDVEEDLVEQMRRRHRIRVLIDAYAVLRRHTGHDLPFRYNGSYDDRNADADRWLEWLRKTRPERRAQHPFDAKDPRFIRRCEEVVADLGKESVNNQLIARKVMSRLGYYAVPFLARVLEGDNRMAQRLAALLLGQIGESTGAPALRRALDLEDATTRRNAVQALHRLGDRQATAKVRDLLSDRDAGVRSAAQEFLSEVGGR